VQLIDLHVVQDPSPSMAQLDGHWATFPVIFTASEDMVSSQLNSASVVVKHCPKLADSE